MYGKQTPGLKAVWYDSCRQHTSTAPFAPGFDHGEPLVFRVPLIVLASRLEFYFDYDEGTELLSQESALWQLKRLAEQLKLVGTTRIRKLVISGHTSKEQEATEEYKEYNRKLSLKRAETVKDFLQNKVSQSIEWHGYGFEKLKIPSKPDDALNRRVEIDLIR